jgi:hypothetical protein
MRARTAATPIGSSSAGLSGTVMPNGWRMPSIAGCMAVEGPATASCLATLADPGSRSGVARVRSGEVTRQPFRQVARTMWFGPAAPILPVP